MATTKGLSWGARSLAAAAVLLLLAASVAASPGVVKVEAKPGMGPPKPMPVSFTDRAPPAFTPDFGPSSLPESWLSPCKSAAELNPPKMTRPIVIGFIILHEPDPEFFDQGPMHRHPGMLREARPTILPLFVYFDDPWMITHQPEPRQGCGVPVGGNVSPWPSAQITVEDACEGIVRFDAFGSSDVDGLVATYTWEFGDGNVDHQPLSEHRYAEPGMYRVELRVTDDAGATSPAAGFVEVPACDEHGNIQMPSMPPFGNPFDMPPPPNPFGPGESEIDSWMKHPPRMPPPFGDDGAGDGSGGSGGSGGGYGSGGSGGYGSGGAGVGWS